MTLAMWCYKPRLKSQIVPAGWTRRCQPAKVQMKALRIPSGMLCPEIPAACRHVLATPGPIIIPPAEAIRATHRVKDARTAKPLAPGPDPSSLPIEPATCPRPSWRSGVWRAQSRRAEVLPTGSASVRGGMVAVVHEDHHVEKERHDAHVIKTHQAESLGANQAVRELADLERKTFVEDRHPRSQGRNIAGRNRAGKPVSPPKRKAIYPKG